MLELIEKSKLKESQKNQIGKIVKPPDRVKYTATGLVCIILSLYCTVTSLQCR